MRSELEEKFSTLEKNLRLLIDKQYLLKEQLENVSQENRSLKEKLEEEKKKNRVLTENQKDIKLHAAIAGNPDHNRLMKNHLNRLVKEIDLCIAQLQNSGL